MRTTRRGRSALEARKACLSFVSTQPSSVGSKRARLESLEVETHDQRTRLRTGPRAGSFVHRGLLLPCWVSAGLRRECGRKESKGSSVQSSRPVTRQEGGSPWRVGAMGLGSDR